MLSFCLAFFALNTAAASSRDPEARKNCRRGLSAGDRLDVSSALRAFAEEFRLRSSSAEEVPESISLGYGQTTYIGPDRIFRIEESEYQVLGYLGKGENALVYKVLDLESQELLALKLFNRWTLSNPTFEVNQLNQMRETSEIQVVRVLQAGYFAIALPPFHPATKRNPDLRGYMLSEFHSGPTLFEFLSSNEVSSEIKEEVIRLINTRYKSSLNWEFNPGSDPEKFGSISLKSGQGNHTGNIIFDLDLFDLVTIDPY